jgi:MFS family permease
VRGLGRWVAWASAAFSVSAIAFAWSKSYALSIVLLVPLGISMMVQMASSNTLIQSMVKEEFRGRVMAVYSMTFVGIGPFGALLAGWLAERIGAPTTVTLGAMMTLTGAAVFASRLPHLRDEARQLIIAQQSGPGEPVEQATATGAK